MGKDLEYRGRSSDCDKNTLLERIILYFNDKIIDIDNDLSMINLVLGLFMIQLANLNVEVFSVFRGAMDLVVNEIVGNNYYFSRVV